MHHEKCHVLSVLSSKSCFHTLRSAVEGHPCLPEAAELGSSALQEVLRFGTREMSLRIGSLAFLSPLKHLTFTFKGSMFLLRPRSSQGTDHAILPDCLPAMFIFYDLFTAAEFIRLVVYSAAALVR